MGHIGQMGLRLPRREAAPTNPPGPLKRGMRGKRLIRLIKTNRIMKTTRIYAMLALLVMLGGVRMQAQEYNSNNTKTPALTQYDYK
jgi:hypothetical protein